MKIENKNAFTLTIIDGSYVASLVELVNACRAHDVNINTVQSYQNGWRVTFEDFNGDAICHDGSYGSPYCNDYFNEDKYKNDFNKTGSWETIGFPWDYDDVSVHTAEELAENLAALKHGENPWDNEDC